MYVLIFSMVTVKSVTYAVIGVYNFPFRKEWKGVSVKCNVQTLSQHSLHCCSTVHPFEIIMSLNSES